MKKTIFFIEFSLLLYGVILGLSAVSTFAFADSVGTISCQIDGKEWKDNKAVAIQTGKSMLNIASDGDRTEALSIILSKHPAAGSYQLNSGASGSYTDASGVNYGSKDGSGTLTISKYSAPDGKTPGTVEGTFSGTFAAGSRIESMSVLRVPSICL